MEEVTPDEIAETLGITGKTFRAWLRSEKHAGHPILDGHEHGAHYHLSRSEAGQLGAEYRASKGRARAPGQPYRPGNAASTASATAPAEQVAPVRRKAASSDSAKTTGPRAPDRQRALPRLPKSFTRTGLEDAGFVGWATWPRLRDANLAAVPCTPGVYIVYRPAGESPCFLGRNPGGWFNSADPTVTIKRLQGEWVPGAQTLYIGKAALRSHGREVNALRERLREYARYGAGVPIGHAGGRLIWQLADADELLVAWHEVTWAETARAYEKRLLKHFARLHEDRRPFANLTG